MRQRIVTTKIAAWARQPEFWLTSLIVWLAASAYRSLGTPWAGAALGELLRWGIGISLALALSLALRRVENAARLLTVAVGALAFCGVWDGLRPDRGGLVGPYLDHQLYGSALLVLLPFTAALSLSDRDPRWRIGAQAAGAAGVTCLILSQARSAWAGLLISALVFCWLWLRQATPKRRQFVILVFSAAAVIVGGFCVWTVTATTEVRSPLTSRSATLTHLSSDSSWQARLTTWRGTAQMLTSRPLVGFGLGRYPGIQAAWTHQGRLLTPQTHPSLSEEAHNFYLQTAAETGMIGLSLYGIALTAFTILGLRRLKQSGPHLSRRTLLVIAALSMVAGQFVDALASPSWQFAEVSLLFWLALGVGMSALHHADAEPVASRLPLPLRRAGQAALAGAIAVLLAAQILPLGLLSPVEAYTSPTSNGYVFDDSNPGEFIYSPSHLPASGGTINFILYAHFTDPKNNNAPHNENVTFDGDTLGYNYTVFNVSGNYIQNGTGFGTTPATRNVLTVSASNTGTILKVFANFYINGVKKSVTTVFTPHI